MRYQTDAHETAARTRPDVRHDPVARQPAPGPTNAATRIFALQRLVGNRTVAAILASRDRTSPSGASRSESAALLIKKYLLPLHARQTTNALLQRQTEWEWSAGSGASDSSVSSEWSAGPGASGSSAGSEWSAGPGASGAPTQAPEEPSIVDDVENTFSDTWQTVEQLVGEGDGELAGPEESDASAHFRAPWIQEIVCEPGKSPGHLNYTGSRQPFDTEWVKDRVGTALLGVIAGIVTAEVLGFVAGIITPFSELVALFLKSPEAAGGLAFWRAYTGFQVQRRFTAELVTVHEWYGRVLYDPLSDTGIVAADFHGIGPDFKTCTIAMLEERLTDADGHVLYVHPPQRTKSGFDLDKNENLPEWSFNTERF